MYHAKQSSTQVFELIGFCLKPWQRALATGLTVIALGFPLAAAATSQALQHEHYKTAGLQTVALPLVAEQWASTDSANVTVSVDASLDKLALARANQVILANLDKIANGVTWHIIQFDRSEAASQLETLHVLATARLPESQLSALSQKAKAVSEQGATYRIASIQFTPSLAELATAKAKARSDIYLMAKQELARLNAAFPSQHYVLHRIVFDAPPSSDPQPMMRTMALAESTDAPAFSASKKVTVMADVILAAPQQEQVLSQASGQK